jgi:hypothetical protein
MRDKIIALAREAGLGTALCHNSIDGDRIWIEGADWHDEVERFYQLAVADAITAADKRIAELEDKLVSHAPEAHSVTNADHFKLAERYREAERKLAVAREALKSAYDTATDHDDREPFDWAVYCEMLYQTLAQIGEK